ncbi:TPA: O-antigen polymerase, partial [Streptococcus suis]
NFVKTKKFEIIDIVIISLFIVQLYFSGSRSPIFRLFTFIIVIYYFITTKSNMNKEQINRVVRKIILFAILLLIIFVASLNLFGRTNNYNGFHYLFIYLGAPLYNLSTFISSTSVPVQQEYFGQQTFISFYNYILPKFGLETITLDIPFVRYNGMYGLGNVYTTFYQFLYDFGAIGVPIFISIIAVYFSNNYFFTKVQREEKMKFSLSLFIYAYLFNDLIMLIFSNRFYETILHVSTLKLLFWVFIIKSTIIDKGFKIGKYKIVFNQ